MIHYQKLRDLKHAMKNVARNEDLLVELFRGMPELQCFGIVKCQEYDDNNYYDSTRLTSVNGHSYGYEGYEDEDEDYCVSPSLEPSNLPKVSEKKIHWIEDAVCWIEDELERDEEEVFFKREDYSSGLNTRDVLLRDDERRYFAAYMAGKKLPDSFFVKIDPKYAVYHALDHGRFKPEMEFKIFAKHGEMRKAVEYARHVIKGRLPEAVENFYFLDPAEEDKQHLQEYIAEFCSAERGVA